MVPLNTGNFVQKWSKVILSIDIMYFRILMTNLIYVLHVYTQLCNICTCMQDCLAILESMPPMLPAVEPADAPAAHLSSSAKPVSNT